MKAFVSSLFICCALVISADLLLLFLTGTASSCTSKLKMWIELLCVLALVLFR